MKTKKPVLISRLRKYSDLLNSNLFLLMMPISIVCILLLYLSKNFPLHDFSNSYFAALLAIEGFPLEDIIFDIHDFNKFAWDKGFNEVLMDFYLNSPFTITFFSPFALTTDAYFSKIIFNLISIASFLGGIYLLTKKLEEHRVLLLLSLPFVFIITLRNHIFFGQSYMLIFAFTIIAFSFFDKKKGLLGGILLGIATLLKIFPLFYGFSLLFNKKWRAISYCILASLSLMSISFLIGGTTVWFKYLFEVLPNAISNSSTIDFRPNSQSIDVFFKTIFVKDPYYNPKAIIDSFLMFKISVLACKSIILGLTIQASFKYKEDLFQLLSIWVTTLFFIQTRTATYAQLLWIIPMFSFFQNTKSRWFKLSFLGLLFLISNFPFNWIADTSILFKFSRLWLSIILAFLFWKSLQLTPKLKYLFIGLIILLPFNVLGIITQSDNTDQSQYVLKEKKYFMIYDYGVEDGSLYYKALGMGGEFSIDTNILVSSFESNRCAIKNNQIYLDGKKVTNDPSLKKKPVLINKQELYYLTDLHSRRGAYTLKKLIIN